MLVRASTIPGTVDIPPLPGPDAAPERLAWLTTRWSQPELRDAITMASPDLAARVNQLLADGDPPVKAVKKAVVAVASYVTRWQRRATPFGLFAGVTTATVGPAAVRFGDGHTAVARADAGWLTRVVDRLELDHGLRRTLMVVTNNAGFVRDGRFIVAARAEPGQRSPGPLRETSTRHTRPVRIALACAATPVRFGGLAAQVADQLPQAAPSTIEQMLHALIDGHVLITNLRPPMTAVDPLAHVVATLRTADTEHLPGMPALVHQLGEILLELQRHNRLTDPRRQAAQRAVAAELMAAVVPVAEPALAVDVRLDATISLPQRVLDEAASAAGVLLRVTSQPFGSHAWLDYHARFRARYGPGAVVCVRDLVADSGLGYPPGFLGAPRARPAWRMLTERDAYVLALVQQTMRDGTDEIALTDADIDALTVGDPTAMVPPARLELGVSVHAVSVEAMNRGEFELRIAGVPRTHTSMAGRFAYLLLRDTDRDQLARTYTAGTGPGAIVAQLSFPPRRVHNENVVRVGRLTGEVVAVAEHPDGDVIGINHLAVTADADQLYLIHQPTGRRVVAHLPHALAAVQMPPLARFLAEVGDARTAVFGPLDLGAAVRTLPYAPRIRYRHTVLAPARWWLTTADLTPPPHATGDDDCWDKALDRWRQRWRVPARVMVCHDELRLPINLDDTQDRRLLNVRLSRADRLELREDAPADRDGWLSRPAEFVIPMALTTPVARRLPVTTAVGRIHRPGESGVVHARLIGNPASFDDILTGHLPAFADSLTDLGVLRWWTSRHRDMIRLDADQHLSFFFRLETPTAYGAVAARLGQFADDLHTRGLPNELVFAAYHEQPGRYGHPPTQQIAEWVFAADTAAATAQLRVVEQTGISGQVLAAASMVQLAAGFAPDPITGYRTLLADLQQHTEPTDRALSDLARDLADPTDECAQLRALAGGDAVLAAWQARQPALHAYYTSLNAERDPDGVLRTLLHEHHVRAVGVDPDFERQTNRLARAAAMRCLTLVGAR